MRRPGQHYDDDDDDDDDDKDDDDKDDDDKCDHHLLGDLRGDLVLSPGLAIRPGVRQRVLVSASHHNVKHPKTDF